MTIDEMLKMLDEKKEKISKAKRVRSLLLKQRGLIKKKQSLTDFDEPVLFLTRRDGNMEIYEKATAGKFVFEHSTGESRFIELRPSDQVKFDYAGRKVRAYQAHEDRPFSGWDNPLVDSESVMLGYEKTKATDLKYQERIQSLKNKGRMTWVYIVIGCAIALAIGGFAYQTWIQPALAERAKAQAQVAIEQANAGLPKIGVTWSIIKSFL